MVKIYLEQFSGQILLENTSEGKHCFRFQILPCSTVNIKPSFLWEQMNIANLKDNKFMCAVLYRNNRWTLSIFRWKTKKYHTFLLRFWYLCYSRNSGIKLFKYSFIDLGLIVWLKSANAGMIVKLKFKLNPDQALETKW